MAEILLRDFDEELLRSIRLRAEVTGRSVEEVIKEAVQRGLLLDVRGRVALADKIRAMTPKPIEDDSTEIIRRLRDAS